MQTAKCHEICATKKTKGLNYNVFFNWGIWNFYWLVWKYFDADFYGCPKYLSWRIHRLDFANPKNWFTG